MDCSLDTLDLWRPLASDFDMKDRDSYRKLMPVMSISQSFCLPVCLYLCLCLSLSLSL